MKLKFDKDVLMFLVAVIILMFITMNVYSGYQPRKAMLA